MLKQILYDTRRGSGTTKAFAEKLANALGLRAYPINAVDYVEGTYILCTYTYGLGEIPDTTLEFLNKGNNAKGIRGVVSNGSSNFKTMGLFAVSGDRIRDTYDVPLFKRLDMGGTNEDVYEVAQRVNYQFKLGVTLLAENFAPQSTFIDGKFTFKERPNLTNNDIKTG